MTSMTSIVISAVCIFGVGASSWSLGKKEGIALAVTHLYEEGLIDLEEEEGEQ